MFIVQEIKITNGSSGNGANYCIPAIVYGVKL